MKKLLPFIIFFFFFSCTPKAPVDIQAGMEECSLCKMKIVDLKFNAQLQTTKGKIHHFDSIECLVKWIEQNKDIGIKNAWVKDYPSGKWVEYKKAFYLVSKNLPSPMGAYLSSYETLEEAQKIQKEKDGQIHEYKDLSNYLKSLNKDEKHHHHHHHH